MRSFGGGLLVVLMALAGGARAETWVDTRHVTYVDVDSFKRGADGLI